jgi:hypothetical protein
MLNRLLAMSVLITALGPAVFADDAPYKLKSEKVPPAKELCEPISKLLSDNALQLTDASGEVAITFWFRTAIPSQAAEEQVKNGLTYREVPTTTVIGAVQFAKPWTDFRKQKIPAGVYTLRLAIQPMDGDHMGTAPYSDFCLLSPAAKDQSADTMEPKALFEMSAQAPGGTHPGVVLLFPNSKPEAEPKLVAKANGSAVLYVKCAVDANGKQAALGFGFTVAGTTTAE